MSNNKNKSSNSGNQSEITSDVAKINRALAIMANQLQTVALLAATVEKLSKQIEKLSSKNQVLSKTVNDMKLENEQLHNEVRKHNLIFCGVPEHENESTEQLKNSINQTISKITNSKSTIQTDTIFRMGQKKDNFNRPIKVQFMKMEDRNLIFQKRLASKPPVFINEDLCKNTRRDHAILREKRKEYHHAGKINIKIDWNQKIISCNDESLQIIDGTLIEKSKNSQKQPTQ
jgi:flagellar biosynthesis regulator FlaF